MTTAQEVTVQNDSLAKGQTGNVQAGFVAGESAAVWLTSPCDGNIVAVQVFWRSLVGTAPQSIEDSISLLAGGGFPTPGPALTTIGAVPSVIVGPVMTDGVFNEFRFLDENQVQPLTTPISKGDEFVVAFRFFNSPSALGPSVVTDTNGCQNGKNSLFAIPGGWLNSCILGVTGDFVIRAVVECEAGTGEGACCLSNGNCLLLSDDDCGVIPDTSWAGDGTDCSDSNMNGTADACEVDCAVSDPIVAENKLGESCVTDADCSNQSQCVDGGCYVPKNKYISFSPENAGNMVAIRVTLSSSAQFPANEGSSWWVQENDPGDPEDVFRLGCDPHFQDWSSVAIMHVADPNITTAAVYDVDTIASGCPVDDAGSFSPATGLSTASLWGDCCGNLEGGSYLPPDGLANLGDVFAAVLGFQGADNRPNREWIDVDPDVPNGTVNLADVFRFVQAFQGSGYPYAGPTACP
ncbi:MAG: hypothetical protein ACPGXK_12465 [Phycisphaerae bacterium]